MKVIFEGQLTTAQVKHRVLDKDGREAKPAQLVITVKADLTQLSREELGEMLTSLALKEEHRIKIETPQMVFNELDGVSVLSQESALDDDSA